MAICSYEQAEEKPRLIDRGYSADGFYIWDSSSREGHKLSSVAQELIYNPPYVEAIGKMKTLLASGINVESFRQMLEHIETLLQDNMKGDKTEGLGGETDQSR